MKFKIDISSDYGCDCMGCGYGSEDSFYKEINDETGKILKHEIEVHGGCLDMDDVQALIDAGHTELQNLHDTIWDSIVKMDIEYWFEQCDDGCTDFYTRMEEDIEAGLFTPKMTFEEYLENNDIDIDYEDYDEDEARDEYMQELVDNEYMTWVSDLDVYERADRWGLDINVVRDSCQGTYSISIE